MRKKSFSLKGQRILVAQPYGIGDALFMLPLLKALKVQAQAESIDVILGSRTQEMLGCSPYINDIHIIDKDIWKAQGNLRALKDKVRLMFALHKKRYRLFVDLSLQPEYGFWACLLGIPVRVGFDYKKRGRFLNRRVVLGREGFVHKSMVEYYADIGRLLDVEILDQKPELQLPSESMARARAILHDNNLIQQRYICLAPGGGATWGVGARLRLWPCGHFSEFLDLIREKISFDGIVVVGGRDDRPLGEEIKKNWKGRLVNCCGETNLTTSAALIKMSRLFIGSDSGIVHLAVAMRAPIISFYGAPDPRVYGPFPLSPTIAVLTRALSCRPCYTGFRYNATCRDVPCLSSLTPASAMATLEETGFFKRLPSDINP